MSKRILAYWKTKACSSPVIASFSESLVNNLSKEKAKDEVRVSCSLEDNCFILTSDDDSGDSVILKRPPFCPIKHLNERLLQQLAPDILQRGVNIGVVVLLESLDNFVLLTKRGKNLRTFPNIWVPPGGHIDLNESLRTAGLREMFEETGIAVDSTAEVSTLGLWESAFPPKLSQGLPKRHHIVVYMHCKENRSATEINSTIKLQEEEVDKCAWLCPCISRLIISSDDVHFLSTSSVQQFATDLGKGAIATSKCSNCCTRLGMMGATVHNGVTNLTSNIDFKPMLNCFTNEIPNHERMSTGTKYALSLWLQKYHNVDIKTSQPQATVLTE